MGMHCIIELLSKYQEIFDKMGRNNSLQILLLKGCVFAFVEPSIRKWVDAFENGQLWVVWSAGNKERMRLKNSTFRNGELIRLLAIWIREKREKVTGSGPSDVGSENRKQLMKQLLGHGQLTIVWRAGRDYGSIEWFLISPAQGSTNLCILHDCSTQVSNKYEFCTKRRGCKNGRHGVEKQLCAQAGHNRGRIWRPT